MPLGISVRTRATVLIEAVSVNFHMSVALLLTLLAFVLCSFVPSPPAGTLVYIYDTIDISNVTFILVLIHIVPAPPLPSSPPHPLAAAAAIVTPTPAHLPSRGVALRPQARAVGPSLPPGRLAFYDRERGAVREHQLLSPRTVVATGAGCRGRGRAGRGRGVEEDWARDERPRAFPQQRRQR